MATATEKMKVGIVLMMFSALFSCVGQLFWKLSAANGYEYVWHV